MAQHNENRPIDGAVELLKNNGFDALAEAVTVAIVVLTQDYIRPFSTRRDQRRC